MRTSDLPAVTRLKKAGAQAEGVKSRTARLIAKNPFRTVAGALAIGVIFAKMRSAFS